MTEDVCPVVVATSPGEGFSQGRWLARWGRTTLLGHVLDEVRRWGLAPGVLILGDGAEAVLREVDCSGFTVILDPEWQGGSAESLRTAFDFLQRESEVAAALVVDAAIPTVRGDVVDALLSALEESDRPAMVPKYRYANGDPVLLLRWLWPQLVGIDRAASLAAALETHPEWVNEVWFDQLPPVVVDTPDILIEVAPRR